MGLWGVRDTGRPALKVNKAHVGGVNFRSVGDIDGCTIVPGGEGQVLRHCDSCTLQDKNGQPASLKVSRGHADQAANTPWNRLQQDVTASGSDDGDILIWRVNTPGEDKGTKVGSEGARNVGDNGEQNPPNNRASLFRHVVTNKRPPRELTLTGFHKSQIGGV